MCDHQHSTAGGGSAEISSTVVSRRRQTHMFDDKYVQNLYHTEGWALLIRILKFDYRHKHIKICIYTCTYKYYIFVFSSVNFSQTHKRLMRKMQTKPKTEQHTLSALNSGVYFAEYIRIDGLTMTGHVSRRGEEDISFLYLAILMDKM